MKYISKAVVRIEFNDGIRLRCEAKDAKFSREGVRTGKYINYGPMENIKRVTWELH